MILTSNRGFAEWGEIFGDPVVATALLDRLLHHAVVFQIEGSSYRLREHADLLPEHIRTKASIQPSPIPPEGFVVRNAIASTSTPGTSMNASNQTKLGRVVRNSPRPALDLTRGI